MKLNRTGSNWTELERNKINENWDIIEGSYNDVVGQITDEVVGHLIDSARLDWKEPVDTVADLPTNAEVGETRMVREADPDGISYVYRYDGENWEKIQEIDVTLVNEVDSRLSSQLADNVTDLEQRGINVLSHGVVGDGVTDDTQALQSLLNANKRIIDIPIPRKSYRITDELIFRNNSIIRFVGGNTWSASVGDGRNVLFEYDGVLAENKAMFRVSTAPVGTEPMAATSNVKFLGNVVLDGKNKIGFGLYCAYVTNESEVEGVLVRNTTKEAIQIEKTWYAKYGKLVARDNKGNGITIGKENWGGVNGCQFDYLRTLNCGSDFITTNPRETGYGVGIFGDTIATKVRNVTSEANYGPGLVNEWGRATEVDTVYLEGNGIKSRDDGKTSRCLGLTVIARKGRGANRIKNLYMSGEYGAPDAQAIWFTGEADPTAFYEFNNILYGHHLITDLENYVLTGSIYYGLRLYIEGHLPVRTEVPLATALTQLYVSANGNDLNNGRSESTAYRNLAKALEKAKAIKTITTINIIGTIDVETLDFSGLDRPIIFNGSTNGKISNAANGKALTIKNASRLVTFINFNKITRVNTENCLKVVFENSPLGHEDISPKATLDATNSDIFFKNSPLSGSLSTGETKNGMLLRNSRINLNDSTITDYTTNRLIRFNDGSVVTTNSVLITPADLYWEDGSGYMISGDSIINSFGSISLTQ